jgi:hypothetical protein
MYTAFVEMKLLTLLVCLSLIVDLVSSAATVDQDDDVSMVKFKKFKVKFILFSLSSDVGQKKPNNSFIILLKLIRIATGRSTTKERCVRTLDAGETGRG